MARVRIIQTVEAPPDAVFRLYVDPDRLTEWQPGLRGIKDRTGPLDRAGTTYVLDQPGPRLHVHVMRVDPPSLHEQIERLPWYGWELTTRFDPLPGDRTRLTLEARYRVRGPLRWLLGPLVSVAGWWFGRAEVRMLRRVAERDWRRTTAGAEHPAEGGQDP